MKERKGKRAWARGAGLLLPVALGFPIGFLVAAMAQETGEDVGLQLISIGLLLLAFGGMLLLQTILHELGHLVFGLLSGYSFLSFRVGSLMWVRLDGRLRLRRFSLPGTGGQCLLAPPEWSQEGIPVQLYNLGGALLNVLVSLPALLLSRWVEGPVWATALTFFGVAGLLTGAINGIPLQVGKVDNDGYNALHLKEDPAAVRAFWLQLKMNEQVILGVRQREMPEEWFRPAEPEKLGNSLVAAVDTALCSRWMDQGRYEEAAQRMDFLLEKAVGLPPRSAGTAPMRAGLFEAADRRSGDLPADGKAAGGRGTADEGLSGGDPLSVRLCPAGTGG